MKEKLPPTLLPAAYFSVVITAIAGVSVYLHYENPIAWLGIPGITVGAILGGWASGSFYPGGSWWVIAPVALLANTLFYSVVFAVTRWMWRVARR